MESGFGLDSGFFLGAGADARAFATLTGLLAVVREVSDLLAVVLVGTFRVGP